LLFTGTSAGYRFQLIELQIPQTIRVNSNFQCISEWQNVGNTPAYESYTMQIQIIDVSLNTTVWVSGHSALDLQSLLPSNNTTIIQDDFSFTNLLVDTSTINSNNEYVVILALISQEGRPNLELANLGLQANGTYLLGNVILTQ